MIRLNINGKEICGHEGQTILDLARENNIEIPTLCYDERVKIYGSCGICVVEMEGTEKLLRSCSTAISNGMVIKTDTPRVRSSRRTALELLLSDHTGDCRPPCTLACPGETDCQGYVGLIANGEYREAIELIMDKLPLPASIGRVCPHPCEEACRRNLVEEPISIANLKSFVADINLDTNHFAPEAKALTGKSVGIIGGGPGGLTAAYFLRKSGIAVTVYDACPKMGGMLRYGIPEYRLPKAVLDKEISIIKSMGIEFVNNVKVGSDITLDYLRKTHNAVLIAVGAWKSMNIGCDGEDLDGCIGGIDFLRDVSLNNRLLTGKRIAVVGGGNTAMDACRTAVRLGASEVYNIYRRTKAEMPAEEIEITEAEEEGVIFKNLTNPIEILGENGRVSGIRLQKMQLGDPDASGRRRPVPIDGAEETLAVDIVIMAIGQALNPAGLEAVELNKRGSIAADEKTFRTNIEGVFAAGDATNKGASIAIEAIGEARKAAAVIKGYLEGVAVSYENPFVVTSEPTAEMFDDRPKLSRQKMPHLAPDERKHCFSEVNLGFTPELAENEAKRCLECGCHDYYECKLLQYSNEYNVNHEKYEGGEVHNRKPDNSNPFILRNPDKCILCGLCARICDEGLGVCALGLIDRGFDTVIHPELNKPLAETNCISCGQCASVCPTGAIGEALPISKSVPLIEDVTETTCSFCSVGCSAEMTSKGSLVLRSLPKDMLCSKGRFGFKEALNERIATPMIRKNGELQEVSFDEAITYITKKLQGLSMTSGRNSIGVSISDKLTNEEMFVLKRYAGEIIGTENIFSFNGIKSGLKEVLGDDCGTSTFDELLNTDVLVLVCSDIINNHASMGLKIKKAVENGAKLIVINPLETLADEWATLKIGVEQNIEPLRQFAKAGMDIKGEPKNACGFAELSESLKDVEAPGEIKEAAAMYANANKAMIVFEQSKVTTDGARLIADIAVLGGHIGSPRDGIIQLKPNCNSQGLVDMGIDKDPAEMAAAISNKSISALLVFGEDVPDLDLSGLEFLMVQDMFLTETAKKADVVLPMSSFLETSGTYSSCERKIQKINQVIPPLTGMSNLDMFLKLSGLSCDSVSEIIRRYDGLAGSYIDRFSLENRTATLIPPKASALLAYRANTNPAVNRFVSFLEKEQLIRH